MTPRYKRINQKLKAHGIDLWYTDCDGDVRPILPYMMEGGINCLFPFEVNGCAHPAELLAEYGKDLRIMGGVDKIQLGYGKEAIKAYLETLVPLVERGGYIPFCDHRCPPNVKTEDYLYYLDLKEKMFWKEIIQKLCKIMLAISMDKWYTIKCNSLLVSEVNRLPNTSSAIKKVRVIKTKTLRNQMVKSALKTAIKNFEAALATDDAQNKQNTFKTAVKKIGPGCRQRHYHKNTGAA